MSMQHVTKLVREKGGYELRSLALAAAAVVKGLNFLSR